MRATCCIAFCFYYYLCLLLWTKTRKLFYSFVLLFTFEPNIVDYLLSSSAFYSRQPLIQRIPSVTGKEAGTAQVWTMTSFQPPAGQRIRVAVVTRGVWMASVFNRRTDQHWQQERRTGILSCKHGVGSGSESCVPKAATGGWLVEEPVDIDLATVGHWLIATEWGLWFSGGVLSMSYSFWCWSW